MRGTKRKIKHIPVKQEIKASIHNRFDIEVIDTKTGEIKQKAYAENVICNSLWTRLFTPTNYFNYIHYGTGSGTPSASDTSLFTFLGYGTPATDNDVVAYNESNNYVSWTRKIQLSETTAVGSTLTEVGIGYGTTAATLVTHAMLKDMNGNTISIAKTSTDIINIYATIFVHWAASYDGGYVDFYPLNQTLYYDTYSGGSQSFLAWLVGKGAISSSYIGAWFASGNNRRERYLGNNTTIPLNRTSTITPTYSAANKTATFVVTRLAVANSNISGGIGCVEIGYFSFPTSSSSSYFSPSGELLLRVGGSWFPSSSITGEAIATGDGTTKDFATDYTMISGATIKVNGVAVTSGITIDENLPSNLTNMGRNFILQHLSYREGTSSVWGKNLLSCGVEDIGTSDYLYGDAATVIYYNPYYSLGISSFIKKENVGIAMSDNGETWVTISSSTSAGTITIPEAYRYYKYWKLWNYADGNTQGINTITCYRTDTNNIHFATAPVSGDVITADYTSKTIAKDTNYVFDLTVVMTLAEKTV